MIEFNNTSRTWEAKYRGYDITFEEEVGEKEFYLVIWDKEKGECVAIENNGEFTIHLGGYYREPEKVEFKSLPTELQIIINLCLAKFTDIQLYNK